MRLGGECLVLYFKFSNAVQQRSLQVGERLRRTGRPRGSSAVWIGLVRWHWLALLDEHHARDVDF